MRRLAEPPPEIWEIRVTEPKTQQVRMLGRFLIADALVLTNFHTRSYLGRFGSHAWATAMTQCVATWNRLFDFPPHTGSVIGDYVTENCDVFPVT